MFKSLFRSLPGLSSKSASKYIDTGGKNAAKYLTRGGKAYDALNAASGGTGPGAAAAMRKLSGTTRAEFVRNNAIRQRQMAVGARYGAGALGVGIGTAMLPNRNQTRGGYNPMPTAKGTGRYA